MDAIEFVGKNTEEAIYNACKHFDTTPEKLDIQILSTGTTGIFGLVGGKKARIKAFLKEQPPQEPLVDLSDLEMEIRGKRAEPETIAPEKAAEEVPEEPPAQPEPAPAPPPQPPKRPEVAVQAEPEDTEEPESDEEVEIVSDLEPLDAAPADPTEDATADDQEEFDLEPEDEEEQVAAVESSEDVQKALEIAHSKLDRLITLSGMTASVKGEVTNGRIVMDLTGESSSLLIGKKGKTLDALQYLLTKMVSKEMSKRAYVVVDSENYRDRREKSLADMALRLGEKAKKAGKPITISPMNSHDRRVVHLALQNDKQLRTKSKGEGLLKRIVIFPQRPQRGKPPKKS